MNGGAKAKFILLNKKSLNKNKKLYTDLLGIFVANSLHYGYAFTEDVLLSFLPDKEDKLLLYVENNFMVNGLGIISHKYIDNNNGGMHIYNLLFSFAFDLQIYKNLLDYFIKNIKHKEEYRLFINIINYDKKEELKIIKKLEISFVKF